MIILAADEALTATGWCVWDTETGKVLHASTTRHPVSLKATRDRPAQTRTPEERAVLYCQDLAKLMRKYHPTVVALEGQRMQLGPQAQSRRRRPTFRGVDLPEDLRAAISTCVDVHKPFPEFRWNALREAAGKNVSMTKVAQLAGALALIATQRKARVLYVPPQGKHQKLMRPEAEAAAGKRLSVHAVDACSIAREAERMLKLEGIADASR